MVLPFFPNPIKNTGVPMMAARFDGSDGIGIAGGIGGGISDGSDFVCSFWVKFNGGDTSSQQIIMTRNSNPSTGLDIFRNTSGRWRVLYYTNAGVNIGDVTSSGVYDSNDGWHHFLFYRSQSLGDVGLYINGVADTTSSASSTAIEWTVSNVYFGRDNTGGFLLNADIADFMLWRAPVPDLSQSTNRERFIKDGRPVYPGNNGEVPIPGNDPYIYLSANSGSFQTNLGLGSNFTVNAGDTLEYVNSGLNYVFI